MWRTRACQSAIWSSVIAGSESARLESAGSESARLESAGSESAMLESAGSESARFDSATGKSTQKRNRVLAAPKDGSNLDLMRNPVLFSIIQYGSLNTIVLPAIISRLRDKRE